MTVSLKLIVSNRGALKGKYGDGLAQVVAAVSRMVAADKARGITTELAFVDDAATMKAAGGSAVDRPGNASKVKRAVDALYRKRKPDYVMILGSVDVVPHVRLTNPMADDDDDDAVPSDLPYACEQAYSLSPSKYLGPTRVVGRLPDAVGATDPGPLVALIDRAASAAPRPASEYLPPFGASTDTWKESSKASMRAIAGTTASLALVPPDGTGWSKARLKHRLHFFNCHGGTADARFYGQKGNSYPIALTSTELADDALEGAVVGAECCYGAELYDRSLANGVAPICETYLAQGAYGFFGSTTVAYGPPDGNACADLVVQTFLRRTLDGASLGRAALEARQEFVAGRAALDPVDLKTLAQFVLLGDPSVQPVAVGAQPHSMAEGATEADAASVSHGVPESAGLANALRRIRRGVSANLGPALTLSTPVAQRVKKPRLSAGVRAALDAAVGRAEMTRPRTSTFAAPLDGGSLRFHLVVGRVDAPQGGPESAHAGPAVRRTIAVRVTELDGQVVSVQTLESH